MKKYLSLSWIKENFTYIILVPTVLGGFWQLAELAWVGIAYIRFFSVNQLVADGLMILFVLTCLFTMNFLMLRDLITPQPAAVEKPSIWSTVGKLIIYSGIIVAIVWFWLLPMFNKINQDNRLVTLDLALIGAAMVLILVFAKIILVVIIEAIGYNEVMEWAKTKDPKFIILSVFVLSVFTILKILLVTLPWLHSAYLLPDDMKNGDYIGCKVKKNNHGLKSYHLKYFNDQYIFVEVLPIKGKPRVEVLKFDDFFSSESCDRVPNNDKSK